MMTRKATTDTQQEPDDGAGAEATAGEKLEELADLLKNLVRSQAVKEKKLEKESARQEQRWENMQHQFSQIQQQVNWMGKVENRGEHEGRADGEEDDDDDDDGEITRKSVRPGRAPLAHREPKLLPLSAEDDIEQFLTTFERMAYVCRWPKDGWAMRLVPLLTGKARSAYVLMDIKDSEYYDKVKRGNPDQI